MKQNQKNLFPMDATQISALCSEGLAQSSVKLMGRFEFPKALDQAKTDVAERRAKKEQ